MRLFNILAKLLDYPDEALLEHLDEVQVLIAEERSISAEERRTIGDFIGWMQLHNGIGIQEVYVKTFDMVPEHDLHLTHHLFGEDRERGPALIDLSEYYKGAGLEVDGKEIPDYLPLMLEYVSTLDELEAQFFLGDARKVVKVLADNLDKAGSPYARLVRIVEHRGHLARAA